MGVVTLAQARDELVRVTLPGGYIVFRLRPDVYESSGFKEKLDPPSRRGQVAVDRSYRKVPGVAQRRTGGVPPGLGVPGYRPIDGRLRVACCSL